MTRIDVVSGFLGAGKTTWLNLWLNNPLYQSHYPKTLIIENEFGDVSIDGGLLKHGSLQMKEIFSGCICCTLVGDFQTAIEDCLLNNPPERIIIEPSGVAKLSDVLEACKPFVRKGLATFGAAVTVIDPQLMPVYLSNFPEFYRDQIAHAHQLVLSRMEMLSTEQQSEILEQVKAINPTAPLLTAPWTALDSAFVGEWMDLSYPLMASTDVFQMVRPSHVHQHSAAEAFSHFGLQGLAPLTTAQVQGLFEDLLHPDSPAQRMGLVRGKGHFQLKDQGFMRFDLTGDLRRYEACDAVADSRFCLIGTNLDQTWLTQYFSEKLNLPINEDTN